MGIDKTQALKDYDSGTSAKGDKWLSNYKKRTDKLARAASDEAQKLYTSRMKDDKVLARRQAELKKLSESDLNAAADAAGTTAYTTGTSAKKDKWAKKTAPYLDEIDRLIPTLPAKTTDVMTNVTKRVGHIAKGLHDLKERGV